MSDLEARIAEVLAGHQYGGHTFRTVDPQSCRCGWRGNSHQDHRAAMLAPLFREREAEAFKLGFDDAHTQHTNHQARRNQPYPAIAYTNPYQEKR